MPIAQPLFDVLILCAVLLGLLLLGFVNFVSRLGKAEKGV